MSHPHLKRAGKPHIYLKNGGWKYVPTVAYWVNTAYRNNLARAFVMRRNA